MGWGVLSLGLDVFGVRTNKDGRVVSPWTVMGDGR